MPRAKRKPKVYLAGPWFTPDALVIHRIAKDVIKRFDVIEPMFPDEMSIGCNPYNTFINNVEAIKDADLVVALIDVKDVGTAWEIGMAYQLHKDIVLVGIDERTFESKTNLMLAFTGQCIKLSDLEKLIQVRYDEFEHNMLNFEFMTFNKKWEGIE